jgi:hypothetical protein
MTFSQSPGHTAKQAADGHVATCFSMLEKNISGGQLSLAIFPGSIM